MRPIRAIVLSAVLGASFAIPLAAQQTNLLVPPQTVPAATNTPATDLSLSPAEVQAIKGIVAAWGVFLAAAAGYFKTFIVARIARKALPDRLQMGTFGKVLAHWALEINPVPGTVPTAVQPASMPPAIVPLPVNPVPKPA